MMIFLFNFSRQHTKRCDWETFEGREKFLDQVLRKEDKLGKRMMYERKQHTREKHLKQPPRWILGTIKRDLNLFELCGNETMDDLHNQHDMTLAYWRQNHQQYPHEWVWDKYYFDLLRKSFESRHELWAWCEAKEKWLKDLVYLEEERQQ
jgi:hypothetical protein